MIHLMHVSTVLFATILAPVALAAPPPGGGQARNGGNAVVCRNADGSIRSVELYDYWEGKQSHKAPAVLGPDTMSVSEKTKLFMKRFRETPVYYRDRGQADRYEATLDIILSQLDSIIREDFNPDPIDDDTERHTPKPPCAKEQFAEQILNPKPGEGRFHIKKSLWDAASNTHRAGIILHEVIYRDEIKRGADNSDSARYLNYYIAASTFPGIDPDHLTHFPIVPIRFDNFQGADFRVYDVYYGFLYGSPGRVLARDITIENDLYRIELKAGNILRIDSMPHLTNIYPGRFSGRANPPVAVIHKSKPELRFEAKDVHFWPKTELRSVVLAAEHRFPWEGGLFPCEAGRAIQFDPKSGAINWCLAGNRPGTIELQYRGRRLPVSNTGYFAIRGDGALAAVTLAEPATIEVEPGKTAELEKDVFFDGEKVWQGKFATPRVEKAPGKETRIYMFKRDERGIPIALARTIYERPVYQEKRVAHSPFFEDGDHIGEAVCEHLGSMTLSWGEVLYRYTSPEDRYDALFEKESFTVKGTQTFARPLWRRNGHEVNTVTVTDDTIDLFKSISCYDEFPFAF
jgi:hypothetical protein